jgi:hypothetical protein
MLNAFLMHNFRKFLDLEVRGTGKGIYIFLGRGTRPPGPTHMYGVGVEMYYKGGGIQIFRGGG